MAVTVQQEPARIWEKAGHGQQGRFGAHLGLDPCPGVPRDAHAHVVLGCTVDIVRLPSGLPAVSAVSFQAVQGG